MKRFLMGLVAVLCVVIAVVTLRIWLPTLTAATGSFIDAYRTVAWLCWVPNAIVAEVLVRRGHGGDPQHSTIGSGRGA